MDATRGLHIVTSSTRSFSSSEARQSNFRVARRDDMLRIGLIMLQGARHVHMSALQRAADECDITISLHELRKASDLADVNPHALVLPGGESTTMRLTGNHEASGLLPAMFEWIRSDPSRPVLGTCAGAILLADPQDGG